VFRRSPAVEKVVLISGGGSGHEPLHVGFVGTGMLDAACPGQIFTSPTPDQIVEAATSVGRNAGVLFIVKNYAGDCMNFEMAAELLECPVATDRDLRHKFERWPHRGPLGGCIGSGTTGSASLLACLLWKRNSFGAVEEKRVRDRNPFRTSRAPYRTRFMYREVVVQSAALEPFVSIRHRPSDQIAKHVVVKVELEGDAVVETQILGEQAGRRPRGKCLSAASRRPGPSRSRTPVRDGKAAKIWCKQRHMEYLVAAIG